MKIDRPRFVAQHFPGHCKIFPERDVMLLPYQARWVLDNSRLKLAVKSRQIGLSWTTAYRVVRQKLREGARLDAWVASRDEVQAQLFLQDAKRFADILNVAAADLGQTMIDDDGHTAYTLRFANGLRAHSMSSNADAQAGKRGDRILDEFALHPDPRKLYESLTLGLPGADHWKSSLASGQPQLFQRTAERNHRARNPKGFSFHRVTLQDALDQGFLYKLQSSSPIAIPGSKWTKADYLSFVRSGCADEESFQQEFCCTPADDNTAFLSYDLIAGCEYREGDRWQSDLLDSKNPLFIGVDIGRQHDLTVIWLVEQVNGVNFTRRVIEMSKQTFDAQEQALYELLKLPMVRRCCIDQSGLGRQFAERAARKFGAYRVEGIDFTQSSKEMLAYPVRVAFEERTIKVPFTNAIRADLRGVRKEVTSSGHTRFAGNGIDTATVTGSGRWLWRCTPRNRLQRAQSRLLRASVIQSQPSYRQDADLRHASSKGHAWATSRPNTWLHDLLF